MLLVSGTLLVIATWVATVSLIAALGALPATALSPGAGTIVTVRRALWLGIAFLLVIVMGVNLFLPMGSPWAVLIIVTLAAVSLVVSLVVRGRRGPRLSRRRATWSPLATSLVFVLVVSQGYLAIAAVGPLTNYDSGLYHVGAVEYARLFPAISGLASLSSPLGYSTAEFPLAALLGAGPWGSEGLRLVNGLFLTILALDLGLRALQRRRGPGFFVLAVGLVAAWVPLIALADYWVTSPSQDTSALILCIAASAYLADAVGGRSTWAADAATASTAAIAVGLVRPTLGAFAAGVLVVSGILALRRGWPRRPLVVVAVSATSAATVMLARDALLSGWLLFPLSTFPLPVEWRAPDPAFLRLATLGYHRDPDNLWESLEGWSWVGPWIQRLPQSWEAYEFGLLAFAAAVAVVATGRRTSLRAKGLLIVMVPSAISVVVWFTVAPPSFRFAWGPLFTLCAIPLGWCLWRMSRGQSRRSWVSVATGAGVVVPLLIVVAVSATTRLDYATITEERTWSLGVEIPYAVSPLPEVEHVVVTTLGGVELRVPTRSEQCWGTFPLCTPTPLPGLSPRGTDLSAGFVVY